MHVYVFSFLSARCFLEEDSHDSHPTNLQRKVVDFIIGDLKKVTEILAKEEKKRYTRWAVVVCMVIFKAECTYTLTSIVFQKKKAKRRRKKTKKKRRKMKKSTALQLSSL